MYQVAELHAKLQQGNTCMCENMCAWQALALSRGVCWLFIFMDTEPSPLRDSFRVRQQGGLPGPPPGSPSPRIHRRPDGLPRTGRAPGPHLTPRSSRRVCFVYTFFLNSPYAGVARLRSATTLFSTVAFNTLTNPLTICSLQIFLVTDLVSSTTRTSLTTE